MQTAALPTLLLAAALLAGCSHASPKAEAPVEAPAQAMALDKASADEAAPAEADAEPAQDTPTPEPTAAPASRLLVYHAEVRVKATIMAQASARLDSLVRASGGFVSAATETRENGEWQQETTLRVPPARFQPLLAALPRLGTIEEKKLSTDDVTAEHADVAAGLAAKRAVERQYTTLLGKSQKIKDVLDVQEKLGEVREEIEATESRLKALNDEVAYSTLTLTLYQPLALDTPDAPVISFGSRLRESFYEGWELLVALVLGLLSAWPLALLAGAGLWWWLRRRARRPQPVLPAATPTVKQTA